MKNFFKDFKDFLNKGSLLELATAVVMGGALKSVIDSLVKNLIMPLINLISPNKSFSEWSLKVQNATFSYGKIIESLINFVIIGFVVFIILKVMAKFSNKKEDDEVLLTTSEKLLEEIRDLIKIDNNQTTSNISSEEINEK